MALTSSMHNLANKWTLWAHLPDNQDWSLRGYISITAISTVEELIAIMDTIPAFYIENCMFFMMKQGVTPMWEDPANEHGGSFSFKVANANVKNAWTELAYKVAGKTISSNAAFNNSVTGITVSPKKKFCIMKIWMTTCDFHSMAMINTSHVLDSKGCMFKRHKTDA